MQAPDDASSGPGQLCPDCGTVRDQSDIAFCEVCGYNFVTGAHGEVGIVPAPTPAETTESKETVEGSESAQVTPRGGRVTVAVDPGVRGAASPEAPVDVLPFTVELNTPLCLVGRTDETRGTIPEIALTFDEAVSRRHALLERSTTGGLLLRDIGAANGTKLNGTEVQPMTEYPLKNGDEMTLGHWSRMLIEAS